MSLVIRSHPFDGMYFVNKGTNSISFEKVRDEKSFCEKKIS